eukprot:1160212-Pelagomonas_calceolata.AAC.10
MDDTQHPSMSYCISSTPHTSSCVTWLQQLMDETPAHLMRAANAPTHGWCSIAQHVALYTLNCTHQLMRDARVILGVACPREQTACQWLAFCWVCSMDKGQAVCVYVCVDETL